MKKVFLFVLVISTFLNSCKKDYETVLENYFKYLKRGDYRKAYDLLSLRDQNTVSYEDFSRVDEDTAISKNVGRRMEYEIINSSLSETKRAVKIKVLVRRIDLKKVFMILPELLKKNLTEKEVDKILKKNKKKIENAFFTKNAEYRLFREGNSWKIDAGYENKKRVSLLLEKAYEYLSDKKYDEALERYEKVLEIENENPEALRAVFQIKEKRSYINDFLNLDYKVSEADGDEILITLSLLNSGTIKVKKAYIEFVFLNSKQEIIFKELKEVLGNINKNIGYNEDTQRIIRFKGIKNYSAVNCYITAIDF